MNWDFVCFSETRAAIGNCVLHGGHRLITHKGCTYGGVAIIIHSRFSEYVITHQAFGDRVLAVRLGNFGARLCMISVYMPHAGYSFDTLKETYDHLSTAIGWGKKFCTNIIIRGDFNTTTSSSIRSRLLFDFLFEHNLWLANEQPNDCISERYTFESSLGVRRQLDSFYTAGTYG